MEGYWYEDQGVQNDVQLLLKKLDAKVAKLHLAALVAELTPNSSQIELLECGTTPAGALDGEELLPIELLECATTPAGALDHEHRLDVELVKVEKVCPSCEKSCLKVRRVDCVTNAPVPQGTTALSTPPFVRAGYDCRNNTTVENRPEAVGWAPLVCAGPLTTSLRGLWVSGLLPPGNGGTSEGAATQEPTERHKGAATQKPTTERRNSRSNLGARGGSREPWRRGATVFLQVVAATAGGTERAPGGVLSRRHRRRVDGLLHLTMPIFQSNLVDFLHHPPCGLVFDVGPLSFLRQYPWSCGALVQTGSTFPRPSAPPSWTVPRSRQTVLETATFWIPVTRSIVLASGIQHRHLQRACRVR